MADEMDLIAFENILHHMVENTPDLQSLSPEQLQAVAKAVLFDELKADLKQKVDIARIPYEELRAIFLERVAKRSKATYKAYKTAIEALEAFNSRRGTDLLEMKAKDADAFISSLEGSSATVRLRTASVSAFFTFLERETSQRVMNPFRGTRERPQRESATPIIPTIDEINKIIDSVKPSIRAGIIAILEHGFRVGALGTLTIWGGRFTTISKGKEVTGTISPKVIEAIKEAGLDNRKPFASLAKNSIQNAFNYATRQLLKNGKINAIYSVHDLRHFFAIQQYLIDRDIYRLKTLLNHASIQVTETYLKGIESYWRK
ncbi:MAG: site-specific integrase [Novosphingobium sp.]|jgi:integrase|nr:site-specific integrase [Novosphingobium sp.]